jgi:hypothetical protein
MESRPGLGIPAWLIRPGERPSRREDPGLREAAAQAGGIEAQPGRGEDAGLEAELAQPRGQVPAQPGDRVPAQPGDDAGGPGGRRCRRPRRDTGGSPAGERAQPGRWTPAQPGYGGRPGRSGQKAQAGRLPAQPGRWRGAGWRPMRGEPVGRPNRGGALAHAGCSGLHWLSRPSHKYSGLGLLYAGLGSCNLARRLIFRPRLLLNAFQYSCKT